MKKTLIIIVSFFACNSISSQECFKRLDVCSDERNIEFQGVANHWLTLLEDGKVDELYKYYQESIETKYILDEEVRSRISELNRKYFQENPGHPGVFTIDSKELYYERTYYGCDQVKPKYYNQVQISGRLIGDKYYFKTLRVVDSDQIINRDDKINYTKSIGPNNPPPPPPPPPPFGLSLPKKEIRDIQINFEIDSSKWYVQNPIDVIKFMEGMGQLPNMKEENIVGLFTYEQFPVINYPSIMILNTKSSSDPPPIDQLEKEFGAMTFSLEDFDKRTEKNLSELISEFDFKKPILIKEKRQLLMETTAQIPNNQTLKVRQSIFFRGRNIVVVQISYIQNRDEKHLEDFNRIVETIELGNG